MRLAPADQDDRLAKAALFTKYAELLPAALTTDGANAQQLVSDLLLGIREVIAGNKLAHQNLFRCFSDNYCLPEANGMNGSEGMDLHAHCPLYSGIDSTTWPVSAFSLAACQCAGWLANPFIVQVGENTAIVWAAVYQCLDTLAEDRSPGYLAADDFFLKACDGTDRVPLSPGLGVSIAYGERKTLRL